MGRLLGWERRKARTQISYTTLYTNLYTGYGMASHIHGQVRTHHRAVGCEGDSKPRIILHQTETAKRSDHGEYLPGYLCTR